MAVPRGVAGMVFAALLLCAFPGRAQTNADVAADGAAAGARALSGPWQFLEELSDFFKESCEPHWVGKLTFEFIYEWKNAETHFNRGGGNVKDATTSTSESMRLENKVQAILQHTPAGARERDRPMAKVVHSFEYRQERSSNASFSIFCRPPGGKSYWRETNTSERSLELESGEASSQEQASLYVEAGSGEYKISVKYPAVKTRWHRERVTAPVGGCENPPPKSDVSDGAGGTPISEDYLEDGFLTIEGKVDPANADTLSGEKVTGDQETGRWTTTWDLHLVKPKSGK